MRHVSWKNVQTNEIFSLEYGIFCHWWLLCLPKTQFSGVGLFLGFKHEAVLVQMKERLPSLNTSPAAWRGAGVEGAVVPLVGVFLLKLPDVNITPSAYI